MDVDRIRKILLYSGEHHDETYSMIKSFCAYTGIDCDNDVLNIMQIVRSSFEKKGYLVFEMPFADDEIGALCYKGDCLGYVLINTSLPRVNVNFAITHEIYHVFSKKSEFVSKVEFSNDDYYNQEEYAANLFAGMLLMPEVSFRRMYAKFKDESDGDQFDILIRLMAYYQVPYMSVLIRCYGLELSESRKISEELLNIDREKIRTRFRELWLDDSILDASGKDDYGLIETFVQKIGKEYIEDDYINERTLRKVLQNMRKIHDELQGE